MEYLRLATPAGVLAIFAVITGIPGDLERNCEATKSLGHRLDAVVKVDNELRKPENADLRKTLLSGPVKCK